MRNPFLPQTEQYANSSLAEALSVIMPVIGMFLMTLLLARSRSAAFNTSIGRILSLLALAQPAPAKEIMTEGELVAKVQELFDHKCPVTGGMAGGMATYGYTTDPTGAGSYTTIKLVIADSGKFVKETANVACGTLLAPDLKPVEHKEASMGAWPVGWRDANTVKVYGCGKTDTFLRRAKPATPLADYITPCSTRLSIIKPTVKELTCCNNEASKTANSDKAGGFYAKDILKMTSAHSEPMMFHDLFTVEKPHIEAFINSNGGKNGKYSDYNAANAESRSFHLVLYSNNGPCDVCKRRLIAAAKEFFATFGADLKIYYAYSNTDHSTADESPRPCTSGMMYGYGESFDPKAIDATKTVVISDDQIYRFAVTPLTHKVTDKAKKKDSKKDSKKEQKKEPKVVSGSKNIYAKLVHYPTDKRSGDYKAANLGTNLKGYYEEYCDQLVSKVVTITTGEDGYGTKDGSCATNYGGANPYTKKSTVKPTTHVPSFLDVMLGVGANGPETFAELLDCCSIATDQNLDDDEDPDDGGDLDWLPTRFEDCYQEDNKETWPCADALAAEGISTQSGMFEEPSPLQIMNEEQPQSQGGMHEEQIPYDWNEGPIYFGMNEEEKFPPEWDEEKTEDWVEHETAKHQQMICEIVGYESQQYPESDSEIDLAGALQQSTSNMFDLVEDSCKKSAINIGGKDLSKKQLVCRSLLADVCVDFTLDIYKKRLILFVAKACREDLSKIQGRRIPNSKLRKANLEKNIKSLTYLLRYLCEVIYGSHTRFSYDSEALYGEAENNERFIGQTHPVNGAGQAKSLVASGLFKKTAQVVSPIDGAAIGAQGFIPSATDADEETSKSAVDNVARVAHRKLRADSAPNVLAANTDTKHAHVEAEAHVARPMAA